MKTLLLCLLPLLAAAQTFGQALSNGIYTVANSAATLRWDDPNGTNVVGSYVWLWPPNTTAAQQWTFTSIGNGYYTIKNVASGLMLDDPYARTTTGAKIWQYTANGTNAQKWLVTSLGSGLYTVKNLASGLLVDAAANTQQTYILQKPSNGASTQHWQIRKKSGIYSISGTVSGSAAMLTLSGASSGSTTTNSTGGYTFSNLANGTYVVAPSESGFTFSPTTASESVSGASISGVNFTATVNTTHSVLLNVTDSDAGISGYRYYRSTTSGNSYALLNTSLAGSSYRDTTAVAGQDYYYVATAVNANGESKYSPQATSGVIP